MNVLFWRRLLFIPLLTVAGYTSGGTHQSDSLKDGHQASATKTQVRNSQSLGPDDVLLLYLNANLEEEFAKAYDLLSSKDKEARSEQKYIELQWFDDPFISRELFTEIKRRISYAVKDVNTVSSRALIMLEVSGPKLPLSIRKLALKNNRLEFNEKAIAYLRSPELQFEKKTETHTLVKEPEGWRIFLDLTKKTNHKAPKD